MTRTTADPVSSNAGGAGWSSKKPLRKRISSWSTRQLRRVGLDWFLLISIFKAGLPPVVALAVFHNYRMAMMTAPFSYLAALLSIFTFAFQPWAKVLQASLVNILAVAMAALFNIFVGFTIVKARTSTTPTDQTPPPTTPIFQMPYNSSAAAVAATWLFVQIYLASVVRNKFPALMNAAVLYSIFAAMTLTIGHRWGNMTVVLGYSGVLLMSNAISTLAGLAVSLLFFPSTSRYLIERAVLRFMRTAAKLIAELVLYLRCLENPVSNRRFTTILVATGADKPDPDKDTDKDKDSGRRVKLDSSPLRKAVTGLLGLHAFLALEVPFAKREISFSKVNASDIGDMYRLIRSTLFSLIEMGSIVDVLERIGVEESGEVGSTGSSRPLVPTFFSAWRISDRETKAEMVDSWTRLLVRLHDPIEQLAIGMIHVFDHFLIRLRIVSPTSDRRPSRTDPVKRLLNLRKSPTGSTLDTDAINTDSEASAGLPARPGTDEFMRVFDNNISVFSDVRQQLLQTWSDEDDLTAKDLSSSGHGLPTSPEGTNSWLWKHGLISLFLYIHTTLYSAAVLVGRLGHYVDELEAKGSFSRRHLVFPNSKRIKKWICDTIFGGDDGALGTGIDSTGDGVSLSQSSSWGNSKPLDKRYSFHRQFHQHRRREKRKRRQDTGKDSEKKPRSSKKKPTYEPIVPTRDPEHLPPVTRWERFGDKFRSIGHFFASPESVIALRISLAVMSVAILSFLRATTDWFQSVRGSWVLMVVLMSMSTTSGQAFHSLVIRIIATLGAIVLGFLVWYIPAGKAPGVYVFYWLAQSLLMAVLIKRPQFGSGALTASIAVTTITGYHLELDVVGEEVLRASGQPTYPVYIFAPYRGLTVLVAVGIAFFWTIFPYPITNRSHLRKQLSDGLYLLSTYYAFVHNAVRNRLSGENIDLSTPELMTAYRPGPRQEGESKSADEKEAYRLAVRAAVSQAAGMLSSPTSAGKLRLRIYSQLISLTGQAHHTLDLVNWELPVGGKFPHKPYADLLRRISTTTTYLTLIEHASLTYHHQRPFSRPREAVALPPSSSLPDPQAQQPPPADHNALHLVPSDQTQTQPINISTFQLARVRTMDSAAEQENDRNMELSYSMLIRALASTSRLIISQTALLAGSLANGQALPPFFRTVSVPPVLTFEDAKMKRLLDDVPSTAEADRLGIDSAETVMTNPSGQASFSDPQPAAQPDHVEAPEPRKKSRSSAPSPADAAAAASIIAIAVACIHEDHLGMRRAVRDIVGELDLGILLNSVDDDRLIKDPSLDPDNDDDDDDDDDDSDDIDRGSQRTSQGEQQQQQRSRRRRPWFKIPGISLASGSQANTGSSSTLTRRRGNIVVSETSDRLRGLVVEEAETGSSTDGLPPPARLSSSRNRAS